MNSYTPASSLGWLDLDAAASERVGTLLRSLEEPATLDVLGLGSARDAFSDMLSPGTSTIQTRLRYFIFLPWIFSRLEAQGVPEAEFAHRLRESEARLIDCLRHQGSNQGVIGYTVGRDLKRMPSAIYWGGLGAWGIRRLDLSLAEYGQRASAPGRLRLERDDDGNATKRAVSMWAAIPAPPEDFPRGNMTFELHPDEAQVLVDCIRRRHPDTLLAVLCGMPGVAEGVDYPWDLPIHGLPDRLIEILRHARCFSELTLGPQLVYNLLLAQDARADLGWDTVELETSQRAQLNDWAKMIGSRHQELCSWVEDLPEFWTVLAGDPDGRLRWVERQYRPRITGSLDEFAELLAELDESRTARGKPTVRELFENLAGKLAWKRKFPHELQPRRKELIGEVRSIMARVGIAALQPDLVVLDEFQRFKDLLQPEPDNFAAKLAHRLFNYRDPETGRPTRTLLLSATPYRMYTTADEIDGDHYEDFLATCSFLFQDSARVDRLKHLLSALRSALTSAESLSSAEAICGSIGAELRGVMARTERLAATPDRDGMLRELDTEAPVKPDDLRAYLRFGSLAQTVKHHEPTEYWKSGPYLVNFMERYKLKEGIVQAAADGRFADNEGLDPGPGLLNWDDIEAYQRIDPQNGRLRWLLHDLDQRRAFELLWIPPSMRYYDTGSVYESREAASLTKRLIFSGWAVVPKVVSSMVSFEAERRAFAARSHNYTADYGRRGGQRLAFRTTDRSSGGPRPGEAVAERRAAAMTAFLLTWPSLSLAALGDPRLWALGGRRRVSEVLADVAAEVAKAVEPLVGAAPATGAFDQRWYWAAPLFLDQRLHQSATDLLLAPGSAERWEGERAGSGLRAHLAEARAMVEYGPEALGRCPDDLVEVLAELAVGGPAQCALRMISSVTGLPMDHSHTLVNAAWVGAAFRSFFNAPEVTAVIVGGGAGESDTDEGGGLYWRDVLRHSIDGNLQAVLDEHTHVLRDWLGYLSLTDDDRRLEAADEIAGKVAEALELRTSSFRVDIPSRQRNGHDIEFHPYRMRTRFAVAFGHQTLDEGGEVRIESVSKAFNSPFWPFVLTSTSIGQEGLDFHLWCHAVVHWNLPSNPVDLEQREGRVHRYKGHAVRRNIAATLGPDLLANGMAPGVDPWNELFAMAAPAMPTDDGEMVPYWVFDRGPAKIERHVPVLPFSRDAAALPKLRKTLAAYRLAFGQPRQEELVEFLGADRSDEDLLRLASRLRIDLSPPQSGPPGP